MRHALDNKILEILSDEVQIDFRSLPQRVWNDSVDREQALFQLGLAMAPLLQKGLIEEVPGVSCVYRLTRRYRDSEGVAPSSVPHQHRPDTQQVVAHPMHHAHALLNIRDINIICEEYGDVYACIEGEKRRRKINRARKRQGNVEIRTAAHDEWKGPVIWFEWVNGLGDLVRHQAQDIR